MKIELFPMKTMIDVNGLKNVYDPLTFERGFIPSDGGLLSYDIFGNNMVSRKETFAYIDLHDYYLHPFIYKILVRMDARIKRIINGTQYFIVNSEGDLVEDDEKGETGLSFLYKNWDKIKFKRNDSPIRNQRIDVLEYYKKDTIFLRYFLVVPPFYRDVNLQDKGEGRVSDHELNAQYYSKLLRLVMSAKNTNEFDFVINTTKASIQLLLVDIYNYFKGRIEKKHGLMRKSLLGKSIDRGSRSVISAPTFNYNRPEDMEVSFYRCGIPLSQCIALFAPFIIHWVKNFFARELEKSGTRYPFKSGDEIIYIELDNPDLYFNEEYIKKSMDRYIKGYGDRFEPIRLPVKDPKYKNKVFMAFGGRNYDPKNPESPTSSIINRPATWTDIFYQAAYDVTADKHVYLTRYPLTDYFGTFPNRISVLSTIHTMPVIIGDKVYPNYPKIDPRMDKEKVSISFIDSIRMSNLYLKGLGGDYDGDQVTAKGIFTQEANIEAEKILTSKTHLLSIYGKNIRTTTNEGIQTLYTLTKKDW